MDSDIERAYRFSANHREQLLQDTRCGCFYCLRVFSPGEITRWLNDSGGTALCPYCGVDAVIGESAGFPLTEEFLQKMHTAWFSSR